MWDPTGGLGSAIWQIVSGTVKELNKGQKEAHSRGEETAIDRVVDAVKDHVKDNGLYGTGKEVLGSLNNKLKDWNFNDKLQGLFDGSDSPAGGAGGPGGSGSGSAKDYNWYKQQVHDEQERVWMREDTKHQREVADLQAAGLNPVLSATNGMASGGSSSSDSAAVSHISDLAAMAISGLTQTASGINKVNGLGKIGQWYSKNAKTIQTAVNTAKTVATIAKLFA